MIVHASYYQPNIFPFNGDVAPTQIDRLQDLTGSVTLNRTKIQEVGRDGIVGWNSSIPSISLSARQFEYGTLDFWRKLTNKSDATTDIALTDFRTSAFDIAAYSTDLDGTFKGTMWYPEYRVAGFGINIGDPQAIIERSFTFQGEQAVYLQNSNKYLIYKRFPSVSPASPETFSVSNPAPAEDPDNSAQYIFRVIRVRGSTNTELTYAAVASADEYAYNSGTGNLTVYSQASDVFKVYYSASSYISGSSYFTNNDSDASSLNADSCTILLATGNTLTRLQSVGIDVTFDRQDVREIGNTQVVSRSTRNITTRITLGRILETWTIEEILRGVAGYSYGKIDVTQFDDNATLLVRLYSDNTKTSFLMGYKFTGLAPTGLDEGAPVADNVTQGTTLEGQDGVLSTVLASIT